MNLAGLSKLGCVGILLGIFLSIRAEPVSDLLAFERLGKKQEAAYAKEQARRYLMVAKKLGLVEDDKNMLSQWRTRLGNVLSSGWTITLGAVLAGVVTKVLVDKYIVHALLPTPNGSIPKARLDAWEDNVKVFVQNQNHFGYIPGVHLIGGVFALGYDSLREKEWLDEACGILAALVTFFMWRSLVGGQAERTVADRRKSLGLFFAGWNANQDLVPDALVGLFAELYKKFTNNGGSLDTDDKFFDALYAALITGYMQQAQIVADKG